MILQAGQLCFEFPRRALIMGIVNATPDSFSDGKGFVDPEKAIEQALQFESQGAEIIDIGGESTRPGAVPVEMKEELRRVLPILEGVCARTKVLVSIDTTKTEVARAAIALGAGMINDVATNRNPTALWRVAAESGAAYVAMHMQGTPQTMQINPVYNDVTFEVLGYFQEKLVRMKEAGLRGEQIVLDVGIGFGKRRNDNLALIKNIKAYSRFERPLMIGVSRKSFLGPELSPKDRISAGIGCACWCAQQGVHIIRTHDVLETARAVRMVESIQAI